MGCFIALLALVAPRIVLFFVWVFTPYVSRAFHGGFIWPFLGLIFLPFTTLIYSLLYSPTVGVTGWAWLWVALAFLVDIGAHSGSGYRAKKAYD
jgi:hypothetical protein